MCKLKAHHTPLMSMVRFFAVRVILVLCNARLLPRICSATAAVVAATAIVAAAIIVEVTAAVTAATEEQKNQNDDYDP